MRRLGRRIPAGDQSWARRLPMADFLLAAWFLWMTPLLTALSSFLPAMAKSSRASSAWPASAASRNLRTHVRSSDLTALLRSVAARLVLIRFSWDLMFATGDFSLSLQVFATVPGTGGIAVEGGRSSRGTPAWGTVVETTAQGGAG